MAVLLLHDVLVFHFDLSFFRMCTSSLKQLPTTQKHYSKRLVVSALVLNIVFCMIDSSTGGIHSKI